MITLQKTNNIVVPKSQKIKGASVLVWLVHTLLLP